MANEKIRIDKYLWAIRLYKTRSQAADACDKGKVKLNGVTVKPSRTVCTGEEYDVKTENKKWRIRVTGIISNRMQFSEAVKYYEDITPSEEIERIKFAAAAFQTGKRMSKIGRPTKKDKRDLDEFMSGK